VTLLPVIINAHELTARANYIRYIPKAKTIKDASLSTDTNRKYATHHAHLLNLM
jgi:hypothetical protein